MCTADAVQTARRRRIADMFALPPLARVGRRPHWWTRQTTQAGTVGARTLAAAGPLYLDEVAEAVARFRLHLKAAPPTDDALTAALLVLGARIELADGRWTHPGPANLKHIALIAAARTTGRARHTHRQVVDLLTQAGYQPAASPITTRHPLIEHITRNRYRILGT